MNKQPRAYAFIDSQNLNLGIQKMRWKLDWRKFRAFLRKQYGVEKAFLFIGYLPENEDLYIQMQEAGYLVVLKPTLEMYAKPHDSEGQTADKENEPEHKKPPTKGNVDAELVLYAMKELPNYDQAVIVSGDGDFYCLVEYLAEKQKLLKVLAPNWMYSSLLKPYDKYIERLDLHRRELSYRPHRAAKKAR